ncbi:hypothetical protein LINGRAHAP2_LOCUS743 [Linum grandiflorum]
MLGETYLTVHQWYRGFNPWTSEVSTTIVWVQLSDLPIEFYNTLAVKRIARRIGHPICVDRATDEGARGKYARVCVEVDLTKPLLSKYLLEGKKYLIAYEGLHGLCTICGMYKKSSDLCKCQLPPEHEMNDVSSDHGNLGEETIEKAAYGGWMNAPTRKQRATNGVAAKPKTMGQKTTVTTGNRFESLVEETADVNPGVDLAPSLTQLDKQVTSPTMTELNEVQTQPTYINDARRGVDATYLG